MHESPKIEDWKSAFILLTFPTEKDSEISKVCGLPHYIVNRYARKMGYKKYYEYIQPGKVFGKYTVLELDKYKGCGTKKYKCRDEDGNLAFLRSRHLLNEIFNFNTKEYCFILEKEKVIQDYTIDKMTVINIAKKYHTSARKVSKLLKKNNIKVTNRHTAVGDISQTYWGYIQKSRFRGRKKDRILDFTITKEYIWELYLKQNKKCALSNVDIIISSKCSRKKNNDTTASLDRINSNKGYVKGNVQWVHKDVNRMKQEFKEDYFIEMCVKIAKNKGLNK